MACDAADDTARGEVDDVADDAASDASIDEWVFVRGIRARAVSTVALATAVLLGHWLSQLLAGSLVVAAFIRPFELEMTLDAVIGRARVLARGAIDRVRAMVNPYNVNFEHGTIRSAVAAFIAVDVDTDVLLTPALVLAMVAVHGANSVAPTLTRDCFAVWPHGSRGSALFWWRLVAHSLGHRSASHVAGEALAVATFGAEAERAVGARSTARVLLVSSAATGVTFVLRGVAVSSARGGEPSCGAAGAIVALAALSAVGHAAARRVPLSLVVRVGALLAWLAAEYGGEERITHHAIGALAGVLWIVGLASCQAALQRIYVSAWARTLLRRVMTAAGRNPPQH